MSDDKYESHSKQYYRSALKQIPMISKAAFIKYEKSFTFRHKMHTFNNSKISGDKAPKTTEGNSQQTRQTKKVASLSELTSTDKDVEIEVEVISHNLREQSIRGEQKQIAFGMLEDNPWEDGGTRVRWEYRIGGLIQTLLRFDCENRGRLSK
ncbi:MAG: hypothetical protein CM15mP47_4860 [Methanobacteriota archaeon]|nr:MAG: hypothetical protein CM15mP47_4860 [Euryarchaeota archaeon]